MAYVWFASHHHAWEPVQGLRNGIMGVGADQMAPEVCLTCILLQWWHPRWWDVGMLSEGFCYGD